MSLLELNHLSTTYPGAKGAVVQAVSDVSLDIEAGEVLGVVGESGCGKSTLGRTLLRLVEPSGGQILFDGKDLTGLDRHQMKAIRRDLQVIFQDPFGSLNPRHSVGYIIGEPLVVHGIGDGASQNDRVRELLDLVGLPPDAGRRYPHEFSGGQRQRIAIARALALDPKLLVADEAVSALDVSIQSQIINLIAQLQKRLNLSILFISHDLSVIRHVSDRIAVMYLGRIVEIGPTEAIMNEPRHPYTLALLSAIPRPGVARQKRVVLQGELPDPTNPPMGCAFHTRCPKVMDICHSVRPVLERPAGSTTAGQVACHLYRDHQ
ncbi:ATP-binding cassette domain-containing protein [Devosia rhodophyticola]|uniref:ATP-binding cassette domain-containing protein n=1 Tax=Devosia rhodophyticola TaxID=3026423 RepID=A0ABY7YXZ4_9HYPH|nr:oligopeptide/dipeptide ABC transporter ATP-binding protein [Devosia rhodophyticola]WDR06258.1 ATP-binding cassette domain-containing protein [Devosia rhodophyticola]